MRQSCYKSASNFQPWRAGMALVCFSAISLFFGACRDHNSSSDAQDHPAPKYVLGTPVKFGLDGNWSQYAVSGWSSAEPNHTWTDGPVAILQFTIANESKPLVLHTRMSGLTKAPELPSQPVTVKVNGVQVAEWEVGAESNYSATISAEVAQKTSPLRIEFSIPKATSPTKLGMGQDDRVLGLNVAELKIVAGAP